MTWVGGAGGREGAALWQLIPTPCPLGETMHPKSRELPRGRLKEPEQVLGLLRAPGEAACVLLMYSSGGFKQDFFINLSLVFNKEQFTLKKCEKY